MNEGNSLYGYKTIGCMYEDFQPLKSDLEWAAMEVSIEVYLSGRYPSAN